VLDIDDNLTIPLTGRVVWVRRIPAGMVSVEQGGFGVQLTSADERWYAYIADLAA
jgi:Tfp pilus assembly protein PilZ